MDLFSFFFLPSLLFTSTFLEFVPIKSYMPAEIGGFFFLFSVFFFFCTPHFLASVTFGQESGWSRHPSSLVTLSEAFSCDCGGLPAKADFHGFI